MSLTFDTLRKANKLRLPLFKNSQGGLAHSKADGSDWIPSQWFQALVGEVGEFANKRKKYERGDITWEQYRKEALSELADVQTYLDILAMRCLDTREGEVREGVDLGQATVDKWNEVSKRVDCGLCLSAGEAEVLRRVVHKSGDEFWEFV